MPKTKKRVYSIGGFPEQWTVQCDGVDVRLEGQMNRFKRRSCASDMMIMLRNADPHSSHHVHISNIAHRTQHKG